MSDRINSPEAHLVVLFCVQRWIESKPNAEECFENALHCIAMKLILKRSSEDAG